MTNKEKQFVKELSELSNKYGIYISGCGCCNSPYLVDDLKYASSGGELEYNIDKKEYELDGE